MNKPVVSIIMNCYNSEKYLKETIESVYSQTFKEWEIIFWDNLSTDNSANIACSFDGKLKYHKGENFLTLGEARNMAISKAEGEYIAILDCDDLWYPEKLEKQINVLKSQPEVDLIYSNYELLYTNGNYVLNKTDLSITHYCNAFWPLFLHKITIPWPTIIMRKNALESVGGFSDFKSVEDFDLLLKMAEKGIFFFIDQVLAVYRIHDNQLSMNFELAKNEILQVYNFWEIKWTKNGSLNNQNRESLKLGKKVICYITGLRALIQNKKASSYFKEAISYKYENKLVLLYIVSKIPLLTLLIRKFYFAKK